MSYEFLNFTIKNSVATIELNRPEIRNAFNEKLIAEIIQVTKEINGHQGLRLCLLKGKGKSFCAGADLNWMKSMKSYSMEENIHDSKELHQMLESLNCLKVPLVGFVQGHALGGGVGLISVCDHVVASVDCQFGLTEVMLGLMPAVISPFVLDKIGMSHMRSLSCSGMRFNSEYAQKIGLIHEMVELDGFEEKESEILKRYMKVGPKAVKGIKSLLKRINHLTPEMAMGATTEAIAKQRISDEGQEGMSALLEKRLSNWAQE